MTYTLSQLHSYADQHGYPQEAARLQHYMDMQADEKTEDRGPILRPRPARTGPAIWQEAVAHKLGRAAQ